MATTIENHAGAGGGIHPLRQLKQTESQWDARLAEAKAKGESTLKGARAAADAALEAARKEAETLHAQGLKAAAEAAEREARKILDDAKSGAALVGTPSASEIEFKFSDILARLFGDVSVLPPRSK